MMRREINAYRVAYGAPLMITVCATPMCSGSDACVLSQFSPNETHTVLMMRMHRVRESDPIVESQKANAPNEKKWGKLDEPKLEPHKGQPDVEIGIPFETLTDLMPDCNERREMLAKDPLACVYGFTLLCRIALSSLFGVRVCRNCPDCNYGQMGCVDAFGSVAKSEGGVFGRIDAYYGSKECQKVHRAAYASAITNSSLHAGRGSSSAHDDLGSELVSAQIPSRDC